MITSKIIISNNNPITCKTLILQLRSGGIKEELEAIMKVMVELMLQIGGLIGQEIGTHLLAVLAAWKCKVASETLLAG
ncbi:hypothetical protein A2U01_0004366 [Trifolium medium]|uniref:Uncharacterized protein n=1 Tax=Trifolium medium TaxID=97028 RepID=A0A392M8D1_9FABA|nr:hypothetical protein [Trifolium medium]